LPSTSLYQAVPRDFLKYQNVFFTNYSSVNNFTTRLPDTFSGILHKADANACSIDNRIDNKPIPRELSFAKIDIVLSISVHYREALDLYTALDTQP